MLKFDPSKVFHEYVYIRSLNKDNIIVAHDDNGEIYRPMSNHKVRANRDTAVRIHKKVFDLHDKVEKMNRFYHPRRACIFYYDGYPLMIDVFMPYRHFDNNGLAVKEADWVSENIAAFNRLSEVIQAENTKEDGTQRDVYIDGESLFFADSKNSDINYKGDNSGFFVQPVRYIRLEKMSIKLSRKVKDVFMGHLADNAHDISSPINQETEMEAKPEESSDGLSSPPVKKKGDNDVMSVIVLKSGDVIGYNPKFDPERSLEDQDESLIVYSPILSVDAIKKFNKVAYSEERNQFSAFFNLNFLIKAGRTIGKHYSFSETDFLNIPKVIEDTGIFNLSTDISYSSKSKYPISLHYNDVLAYMFRFLHQEKDLNVYRDLVSMFKMAMMSGSFEAKDANNIMIKEGRSLSEITIKKMDQTKVAENRVSDNDLLSDCPISRDMREKAEIDALKKKRFREYYFSR